MTPIAVVTGASRGIGAAILQRLSDTGYECVVVGLTQPDDATHAFIRRDLSDSAEVAAATDDIREYLRSQGRPVAVLVNNAGGAYPSAAHELTLDRAQADITLNLLAPMLLASAVLPGMRASGTGAIINISSTAGRTGVAFLHAYSAAKAGLIAFTQSLAAECAAEGVRVNCVCPGAVDTGSAHDGRLELSRLHRLEASTYEQAMVSRTGLGRLLRSAEVAEIVHWLAVHGGTAVNGQTINVCGTLTMG